ncbi:MAG TPA: NAD(P)H-quinone oxidoreductase [Acidobacteriaceae bacterium]|jgi:NADPH2:quinone reductase|nr:NAD(P)H-quinone oxidoreductase [Acidobacteriaceae bacterium]
MKVVELDGFGGPEVLRIAEAEKPHPGPGEVLIRVVAAGLNRADIHQRQGNYPPPAGASQVLGLEVAGTVAECAPDADPRWNVGDAVCALVPGGGYAEYCVAHSACCLPIPAVLEKDPRTALTSAASLPEATMTVWANLFDPDSQCGRRLFAGERFFMQGGTSGIGTIALQAAMALGAYAAATAGSDEKCQFLRELGCQGAWNYRKEDWAAAARAWGDRVGGSPAVDVILDLVGGDYFPKHIELLARDGRLIHIAHGGGPEVQLDLRKLMLKRLIVTGSTLRSRPIEEKRRLRDGVEQHLWPLVNAGKIRPVIDHVYPVEDVAEAHRRMESSEHIGKIVLRMSAAPP